LSLNVTASSLLFNIFENTTFRVTVVNEGTETMNNIYVDANIPNGLVFTGVSQTQGLFNLFTEMWNVGELAPGESAYLDLILFTLTDNQDITFSSEVLQANPTDVDSTPGNGIIGEDDDDSVTISPTNGGGTGNPTGDVDLELSIAANLTEYTIYEPVTYTLTLTNNGSEDGENIVVSAGLPAGFAFTDASTSDGNYNLFFEQWSVDFLAVGESAELNLTLFPLVTGTDVTQFVEVFSTQNADPDSTPGNGNGVTPNEDDEAAITLGSTTTVQPLTNISALQFANGTMAVNKLYPNPAVSFINVNLVSMKEVNATISIVNLNGQVVRSLSQTIDMGINELFFDISDLPNGNYYIDIDGVEGNREARQFVKVN